MDNCRDICSDQCKDRQELLCETQGQKFYDGETMNSRVRRWRSGQHTSQKSQDQYPSRGVGDQPSWLILINNRDGTM